MADQGTLGVPNAVAVPPVKKVKPWFGGKAFELNVRIPGAKDEETHAPTCAQGPWQAVVMFGMAINSVGVSDVFDAIDIRIAKRKPGYLVTPNVDHVCMFQDDSEFRKAYGEAFLVLPDGMPLLWAGHLLRTPFREKISGSDLIYSLSEHAAKKGHSIFLLGAAEGVGAAAARRLQSLYPGLKVAGTYSPPAGFDQRPDLRSEVVRRVREANPDICFVALGSPRQEIWIWRNYKAIGAPALIGVGGAFDYVTGVQKRAPKYMQSLGLEWFWRLCHEPRRLWERYVQRDMRIFPRLVWRELRGKGAIKEART